MQLVCMSAKGRKPFCPCQPHAFRPASIKKCPLFKQLRPGSTVLVFFVVMPAQVSIADKLKVDLAVSLYASIWQMC